MRKWKRGNGRVEPDVGDVDADAARSPLETDVAVALDALSNAEVAAAGTDEVARRAVGVRADEIGSENAAQNGRAERELAEDFVGRERQMQEENNADRLLRRGLFFLHLQRLIALLLTSLFLSLTPSKSTIGSCELSAYSSFASPFCSPIAYQHFLIVQIVVQIIHEFRSRGKQTLFVLNRLHRALPRQNAPPRGRGHILVPRGIQRRRRRRQIPGNVHVYAGIRAGNRRPRPTLDPRGSAYLRFRVAR